MHILSAFMKGVSMKQVLVILLAIFAQVAAVQAAPKCIDPTYTLFADKLIIGKADIYTDFKLQLGESACHDFANVRVDGFTKQKVILSIKAGSGARQAVQLRKGKKFRGKSFRVEYLPDSPKNVAHLLVVYHEKGDVSRFQPIVEIPDDQRLCLQVVVCAIKDGVKRTYSTPCAAEDDGAKVLSMNSCDRDDVLIFD